MSLEVGMYELQMLQSLGIKGGPGAKNRCHILRGASQSGKLSALCGFGAFLSCIPKQILSTYSLPSEM